MQLLCANATAPQKLKKTPSKVAQKYSKNFRISEWDWAFWITVFVLILLSSNFYFLYLLKEDYLSIHEANSPKQRQKETNVVSGFHSFRSFYVKECFYFKILFVLLCNSCNVINYLYKRSSSK